MVEAFFPGNFGKTVVHIGPFIIFPCGGVCQVGQSIRNFIAFMKQFEADNA